MVVPWARAPATARIGSSSISCGISFPWITVALRFPPVTSNSTARFHLVDILDRFAHLRAHPDKDSEQAGARFVQADIPNEKMTARLSGRRDEPKGG